MDLKEIVGTGKTVEFQYYRKGSLYYKAENGLIFPVPIDDCGDATFQAKDKALLFMRYIRKELDARAAEQAEDQTATETQTLG